MMMTMMMMMMMMICTLYLLARKFPKVLKTFKIFCATGLATVAPAPFGYSTASDASIG